MPPAAAVALAPDPILDAPVASLAQALPIDPPGWPCHACGGRVALDADVCTACGAPFLPKDAAPTFSVPGFGDVAALEGGGRWLLMGVGATLLTLLLLGVLYAVGSLL